nr:MAG TPA: Putative transmembrane protein [Caudoviricetes sp.]
METIKQQIKALNGVDFAELRRWIFDDEVQRRQALPAVQEAEVELVKDLAAQGEITRPEVATEETAINGDGIVPAWHDPQGRKSRAYMRGDAVLDEGRIYINRADGLNYARPSSPDSGWEVYNPPKEDVVPEPEAPTDGEQAPGVPAWKEPQSKTELYPAGAEVTHQGKQWRSTTDGNRAEPGTDTSWEETSE